MEIRVEFNESIGEGYIVERRGKNWEFYEKKPVDVCWHCSGLANSELLRLKKRLTEHLRKRL